MSITFFLYIRTVYSGRVGDFPDWLLKIRTSTFLEFVNWNITGMAQLYQFTQLVTYALYQCFGIDPWIWYIIHISIHAFNCVILYNILKNLFKDVALKNPIETALFATLLFCVNPLASEAIVYKAAFHFLFSQTLMLVIIRWTQLYIQTTKIKYALFAGVVFFLSTYSLEIFILTPAYVICFGIFYAIVLKKIEELMKILLFFTLPQIVSMIIFFIIIKLRFNLPLPHNAAPFSFIDYAAKSMKYVYHILFFGRYAGLEINKFVYKSLESYLGISIFYCILGALFVYTIVKFKKFRPEGKLITLFFIFCLLTMVLLSILWFPDSFLILTDRYAYILNCFLFLPLVIIISKIPLFTIRVVIISIYALFNIVFTVKTNELWHNSTTVWDNMRTTFPNSKNKISLLLDLPQCLDGAIICGAQDSSEFLKEYNLSSNQLSTEKVYDVAAFNMMGKNDGAHVAVINDSTLLVVLNQWGSWWWFNNLGAISRENEDFKVNMLDAGYQYELVLKHPYQDYELLFQTGGIWKTVDMENKENEQY